MPEQNKYPVITDWLRQRSIGKSNPMFCMNVNTDELESEINSLLAKQEEDAGLIRELAKLLKDAAGDLEMQLMHQYPEETRRQYLSIEMHYNRDMEQVFIMKSAISKAQIRLREGE